MPFNNDDKTGIVYVWIGSKSDPEEARLIQDIAEDMFNNVKIHILSFKNYKLILLFLFNFCFCYFSIFIVMKLMF